MRWSQVRPGPSAGRQTGIALGIALLLAGSAGLGLSIAPVAAAPAVPGAHPAELPPLGGGPRSLASGGVRPLATDEFYTQIGATLTQFNSSFSLSQVGSLAETIRLVNSPYPTAYELNLLTTTGDWYQIAISDNWPGCSAGFEELYEIWNNADGGQPVVCDSSVALRSGDLVRLNGSLPGSVGICLGLDDLTTGRAHVTCLSQLDPSAGGFVLLSRASDSNGYYTGTMTEIVNLTASSCPDYRLLPTVTFDFPSWAHVTEFVPWSDEWDNVQGGAFCYSHQGSGVLLGTDPSSHYLDATGGSAYGPQVVQGMNATRLNASVGFRFQSDPVPLSRETVSPTGSVAPSGTVVTFSSGTQGGVSPYGRTLWTLDNDWTGVGTGSSWNVTAGMPGNYSIVAYGSDAQGDVIASAPSYLRVPYPLSLGPLSVQPGPGIDVGESATIGAAVSGGLTPLTFVWSGLPSGCTGSDQAAIVCDPIAPGTSSVSLTVVEANGSSHGPIGRSIVVAPALALTIGSDRSVADVGQTGTFWGTVAGGAGGDFLAWSNLPVGCTPSGGFVSCTFSQAGGFEVTAAVTDTNQVTVRSSGLAFVVSTPLEIAVALSGSIVDAGSLLTITSQSSGGSGGLRYEWTSVPAGCPTPATASFSCRPTTPGGASVALTALDRANFSASTLPVDLTVAPTLEVTLSANRTDAPAPADFAITPTIVQGSTVQTINWSGLPPGCRAGGLSTSTCTGLGLGSYLVAIDVIDVGGGHAQATVRLNVTSPSAAPPPSAPAPPSMLLILLLLTAVAAVAVAIGLSRRRRPPNGAASARSVEVEDGWARPITGDEPDEF